MRKRLLALLLALTMVVSILPVSVFAVELEKDPLIYVSIGDSMTNGYGLDGYDGESGVVNYANDTYANRFAAYLAGYNSKIENDQVIFTGTNGTVDHRQLAMSGLRSEDLHWVLELDYDNDALMQTLYNAWYAKTQQPGDGHHGWTKYKDAWFNEWGFTTGDYRTWTDFCDYTYRYADAAARILANYNGNPANAAYYAASSKYVIDGAVQAAIDGLGDTTLLSITTSIISVSMYVPKLVLPRAIEMISAS